MTFATTKLRKELHTYLSTLLGFTHKTTNASRTLSYHGIIHN